MAAVETSRSTVAFSDCVSEFSAELENLHIDTGRLTVGICRIPIFRGWFEGGSTKTFPT